MKPLLIWHPGQLLIGSYLTTKISSWADEKDLQETVEGSSISEVALEAAL